MPGTKTPYSYGRGIALTGKPDVSLGARFVQRAQERKAEQRAAERREREKKRGELEGYIKNIEVDFSKYDTVYHDDIKMASAEVHDALQKAKNKNPYGNFINDPSVLSAKQKWSEVMGTAELGSKEITKMKDFVSNPKNQQLFDIKPELHEAYLEAQKTGNADPFWDAVEGIGGIRGSAVNRDMFYAAKPKEINLTDDARKMLSLFREAKERGQIAYTEPDGTVVTKKTEELTPKDLESILDKNLLNLDIAGQVERTFGRLSPDDQKKYKTSRDWYIKTFAPFLDKEVWERRTKPAAEKKTFGFGESDMYKLIESESPIVTETFLDQKIKPTKTYRIQQAKGWRGKRTMKIEQQDSPIPYVIEATPQYIVGIGGKWHILVRTEKFRASKSLAKEEGYEVGQLIEKTKDYLIEYKKYEKDFETWSGGIDLYKYMEELKTEGPVEEIEMLDPKTNKIVIFDAKTKKFIRWK